MFNLNIKVGDEEMKPLYEKQIEAIIKTYSLNSDSGFDLFCPKDIIVKPKESVKIDFKIQCEPRFPGGYFLYPRSSIVKTPLILKNSVGIIDSQYRNNVMAFVYNTSETETYEIKKGDRLFQLCHPSLHAMTVKMVDSINTDTLRGMGGFGSTGK